MPKLQVQIKHSSKVHALELDIDQPPRVFKEAVSAVTGVPVERVKVMVKGGMLKDDSDWKKIAPKAGQTFMVIGAATELPKPPPQPTVFLEDLGEHELAQALAMPVGLTNLGNTCYMNATVQAIRAIPELQDALKASTPSLPLPRALGDLYQNLSRTTTAFTPMAFLTILRQVVPQFGEVDRSRAGKGGLAAHAQQDAEECWGAITNSLREVPGLPGPSGSPAKTFVEQYLMGEMQRTLKCDEAPEEPAAVSTEKVLKVECNIGPSTTFMLSGILDALNQKIEKQSPTLGRQAEYTQTSRLSRLPSYLTVHMVRFFWRRDIQKKTKIMKKVKFPTEFDALDLVTDDLKAKLEPVKSKLMDLEKTKAERRKIKKRTKNQASPTPQAASSSANEMDVDAAAPAAENPDILQTLEEREKKEKEEIQNLVDPSLREDVGASVSGLYDLVAIVTHKGAAADAGHYIGFVKKSVFHPELEEEGDEDWYKFDDDKVSVFPKEKLGTLDGGGEDSSAYVLLYKTRSVA